MTNKKVHVEISTKKNITMHGKSLEMLTSFGLTKNEASIYIYLLERGVDVGGSKIALGTHLHRQYVYLSLIKLTTLGLIEAVKHGKQQRYKAVAPSIIEKIAKKRVLEAEDIVRELNTFSNVGREQDFEVFVGNKQMSEHELDYVRTAEIGEEQYIIGGHSKGYVDALGDSLDELFEEERRKKIKTFYIGSDSEEEVSYSNPDLIFEYRTLKDLPKGVTHTVIRKDSVSFYSFLNPSLVYVIKSKIVAENYKQFFYMLWNLAQSSTTSTQAL